MAELLSKSGVFSPVGYNSHRRSLGLRSGSLPKSVFPISSRLKLSFPLDSSKSGFSGLKVVVDENGFRGRSSFKRNPVSPFAQLQSGIIGRSHKWWEKDLQPNMKEITSAQDLVDSLLHAGDKLVVVEFFAPGCGGCKALHPKMCQLAGLNPDVQFLQINYEEMKSMCYSLGVHVLPFFRFYKGADGRVANFSCTNATIKKFKDALAKYSTRHTVGPPKGLEEKELLALAKNKDLVFTYTPKPVETEAVPVLVNQDPPSLKPVETDVIPFPVSKDFSSTNAANHVRPSRPFVAQEMTGVGTEPKVGVVSSSQDSNITLSPPAYLTVSEEGGKRSMVHAEMVL